MASSTSHMRTPHPIIFINGDTDLLDSLFSEPLLGKTFSKSPDNIAEVFVEHLHADLLLTLIEDQSTHSKAFVFAKFPLLADDEGVKMARLIADTASERGCAFIPIILRRKQEGPPKEPLGGAHAAGPALYRFADEPARREVEVGSSLEAQAEARALIGAHVLRIAPQMKENNEDKEESTPEWRRKGNKQGRK